MNENALERKRLPVCGWIAYLRVSQMTGKKLSCMVSCILSDIEGMW